MPIMPAIQAHCAVLWTTWQILLAPHGCALHGLGGSGRSVADSAKGGGMAAEFIVKINGLVIKRIRFLNANILLMILNIIAKSYKV